MQDTNKNPHTY